MGIGNAGVRGWRDERGAALVEFSIVVVMLISLLFAMISFGYILSFKQGMTQATAEGARAAAVAPTGTAAVAAAAAAASSVSAFDQQCNLDGLACSFGPTADCDPAAPAPRPQCITVEMVYDYENYPLLAPFPLISALLPDTLHSSAVAQVNS
jgi:Flp pilus assembly pilin Flp